MVSIVVPVYNVKDEDLKCCIDSLVKQTYKDIEILLIDDGSDEETVAVEKTFSSKYACVRLIQQSNSGVSEARNRGIKAAKGEFVCFVDADDYIEPDMVEKMLSKIDKGHLVVSNLVHNDSYDNVLSMTEGEFGFTYDDSFIKEYLVGNLGKQIAFSACNKIFDLGLLVENSIFFPTKISIGEDMIFVLKYLSVCSVIRCINEGLYHYRIQETSAMNSKKKDYLELYCETLKELQQLNLRDGCIVEETLARWALEVLTYVLTNLYVKSMTYAEFGNYYRRLIRTPLFATAIKADTSGNFKRNVLRWVLSSKSKLLLYAIIKVNC